MEENGSTLPPGDDAQPDPASGPDPLTPGETVQPLPGTTPGPRGRMTAALTALAVVVAGAATAVVLRSQTGGGALETKAPADALVFMKLSLRGSEPLARVLSRFGEGEGSSFGDRAVGILERGLAEEGIDFSRDIGPWIGSEIGFAVAAPEDGEAGAVGSLAFGPEVVGMLAVRDEGAARTALGGIQARTGDGAWEVADGVAYLATQPDHITRLRSGADAEPLSADATFLSSVEALGDPGFGLIWSNGGALTDFASSVAPGPLGILGMNAQQANTEPSLAVMRATADGIELVGRQRATTDPLPSVGSPELLEATSAGLFGALTVFDPAAAFEALLKAIEPTLQALQSLSGTGEEQPGPRAQVEGFLHEALGLDLQDDIYAWAHGELSILLGGIDPSNPDLPVDVAAIFGVTDEDAAGRTMTALQRRLDDVVRPLGARARSVADGVDVTIDPVRIAIRRTPGRIIVASSESYAERLLEDVPDQIANDTVYRRTFGDLEDTVSMQLFVRLDRIRGIIETFLPGDDRSSYERDAAPFLRPLETLGVRVTMEDGVSSFRAVLTLRS